MTPTHPQNPHSGAADPATGPPPRWNIKRAGVGKFQASLDEWWITYEPPGDLHQQEGTSRQPFRGQPTQPFLSALPGPPATAPTGGFYNEDVPGAQPPSQPATESCTNDSPTPPTCAVAGCGVSRSTGVSGGPGRPNGWSGAPFQPAHLPRPAVEEMSGRLPVPPRPDQPPTHTPPRGGRGLIGVFTARGSSAHLPPRDTPPPATRFDNTARGCQGGAGGNLTWRNHLFTRQELSSARKKGATQLQGRTA
ncbi:hypothetical protein GWK47_053214 [Chionoecetes opilio]|uniref:Uncharacterized protein n=1 Tax=Chionoecetes opilio TaxID=41210 RepID=A0A8J4Y799_CHIOP|nr:hypothetical protein GWK47_053214 [Chionoecetes opilio]